MKKSKKKNSYSLFKLKKLDFHHALFLLRVYYAELIDILNIFCGLGACIRSEKLDTFYQIFKRLVDGFLKLEMFSELAKKAPPLPFESLIGDIQDCPETWACMNHEYYNFSSKIDNLFYNSGAKTYEVSKDTKDLLELTNKAKEEYKSIILKINKNLDNRTREMVNEQKAKAKSTSFNLNGDLMVGDTKIVTVKPGTIPFYFLETLYERFNETIPHEDLHDTVRNKHRKKYDKSKEKTSQSEQDFSHNIRSNIKQKKIKTKELQELFEKIIVPSTTVDRKAGFRMTNP